MSSWLILLFIVLYLGFLVAIAFWAERFPRNRILQHSSAYTMGLAVYCTAWTYYGSIGLAATSGLFYLPIYLGPIIAAPLFVLVLQKIIKISQFTNATSIADFISIRYGNNRHVGLWVALICLIAIIPYISLQLKAISESFHVLNATAFTNHFFNDFAFYIAVLVAIFTSYFGTKTPDARTKKPGLMSIIAFESLFKLVIFLLAGIVITFICFDGFGDIHSKAKSLPNFETRNTIGGLENGINFLLLTLLSLFAIFLLPRQFHASVIEYRNPKDLQNVIWQFPLYLLLFNIFVFPIAWGGNYLFQQHHINPDNYILSIPLFFGYDFLALLVFLGGISASISMILISSVALSNMLSNNILIPHGLLPFMKFEEDKATNKRLILVRRISIFILIMIAYVLYKLWAFDFSLVSIGLIAFTLISQLAPSFFGALYWNRGSSVGALVGMISGLLVCMFFIFFSKSQLPFALNFFEAVQKTQLQFIPNMFFWSLLLNGMCYLIVSIVSKGNYRERNNAEIFVNITHFEKLKEQAFIWKGTALREDIIEILNRFLGKKRTEQAMRIYNQRYYTNEDSTLADSNLIKFSENLLTGTIGAASARILLSKVSHEEELGLSELLNILQETKETTILNKKLEQQSLQLTKVSTELSKANEELKEYDKQKDEFLDTVAHELKTPITSIRLATEVLEDEDMPSELRQNFLQNIISESERLSRLINQLLDIEKLVKGRVQMDLETRNFHECIVQAVKTLQPQCKQKNISIEYENNLPIFLKFDNDRMSQVLHNILYNSIKFVPQNTGKIVISVSEHSDEIVVCVEDNGKGISPEERELIFDRFYQVKNQNFKKPKGSGLGLAISKQIVEAHHGTIIATESELLKGAKLMVRLPKIS